MRNNLVCMLSTDTTEYGYKMYIVKYDEDSRTVTGRYELKDRPVEEIFKIISNTVCKKAEPGKRLKRGSSVDKTLVIYSDDLYYIEVKSIIETRMLDVFQKSFKTVICGKDKDGNYIKKDYPNYTKYNMLASVEKDRYRKSMVLANMRNLEQEIKSSEGYNGIERFIKTVEELVPLGEYIAAPKTAQQFVKKKIVDFVKPEDKFRTDPGKDVAEEKAYLVRDIQNEKQNTGGITWVDPSLAGKVIPIKAKEDRSSAYTYEMISREYSRKSGVDEKRLLFMGYDLETVKSMVETFDKRNCGLQFLVRITGSIKDIRYGMPLYEWMQSSRGWGSIKNQAVINVVGEKSNMSRYFEDLYTGLSGYEMLELIERYDLEKFEILKVRATKREKLSKELRDYIYSTYEEYTTEKEENGDTPSAAAKKLVKNNVAGYFENMAGMDKGPWSYGDLVDCKNNLKNPNPYIGVELVDYGKKTMRDTLRRLRGPVAVFTDSIYTTEEADLEVFKNINKELTDKISRDYPEVLRHEDGRRLGCFKMEGKDILLLYENEYKRIEADSTGKIIDIHFTGYCKEDLMSKLPYDNIYDVQKYGFRIDNVKMITDDITAPVYYSPVEFLVRKGK